MPKSADKRVADLLAAENFENSAKLMPAPIFPRASKQKGTRWGAFFCSRQNPSIDPAGGTGQVFQW
jgi:hypothetical protein